MKRNIASYLVLLLYIVFSTGVIIENHLDCSVCDEGQCDITYNQTPATCDSQSCCHEEEKHHHTEPCDCTIEEYKIQNDYISENRTRTSLAQITSLLFTIPFINNEFIEPNTNSFSFFYKYPDKRLFSELSVFELSSILC